jgi:WD repeat-containing protein 48
MEHHTDWVNDIMLCLEGKYIFSASSDATLKLWDAQTGQCTATLRTHKDYIKALAYSPVTNMVVSAGLEHSIFMWDLGALVNLTAANNTITTNNFSGNRHSVYSLCMDHEGKVLASGSSDKIIRIWDVNNYTQIGELRGHADNIRTLAMSEDGQLVLSGSSDGTIRLWSIGQQSCIETFRIHDEGVWTVAVDNCFSTFYSGGRDKHVFMTDLKTRDTQHLFTEDAPIIRLTLDPIDNTPSIWAATTNTHINKWPIVTDEEDPQLNEEVVTDLDNIETSLKPIVTIPGGQCLREYRILSNKREILTRDSQGNVALWNVLLGEKMEDLGQVDLDEEAQNRAEQIHVPNWFSVELKTGMLTIRLEESDCYSTWVLASKSGLPDISADLNLNLGALMLRALYEHWPEAYLNKEEEEEDEGKMSSKSTSNKQKYFSVPPHTPIYLAEAGDCGCTLARLHCKDAAGPHESKLLQQHTPQWILDYVSRNTLPKYVKLNFSAAAHPESFLSEKELKEEHLQAPDFLPVQRIVDRVYSHLYKEEGLIRQGQKVPASELFVLYCNGQLVDLNMDFRSVRYFIWKNTSEIKFLYAFQDDRIGLQKLELNDVN